MSKQTAEDSLPDGLLEALGGGDAKEGLRYLSKRPNFARVAARLKVNGWKRTLTRGQYVLLWRPVKTLKTLERQTRIDTNALELVGQDINAWSTTPGGQVQVKARYAKKRAPLTELKAATPIKWDVTATTRARGSLVEVMSIPDIHFGFADVGKGKDLEPLHDLRCVDIYLAVAREFQPAVIVVLGDLLDFAPFSRFLVDPRYRGVTQHAIQHAYAFLAGLRHACPRAKIVMLEGNHEHRIAKHLAQQAPELVALTRAENAGEPEQPVLSIPYLLRTEDIRVDYHGPYGARFYHNGTLYTHGEITGPPATVLAKLLAEHHRNVVTGHTHHAGILWATEHDEHGPRDYYAMMCGTGARRDGIVPGSMRPKWQQTFGFEWFGGQPEIISIRDGVCSVAGRLFSASVSEDGIGG